MNKTYYPYSSDKPDKKYFIITSTGKKIYFGQAGYNDYTIYYSNEGNDKADKMKKSIHCTTFKNGRKLGQVWY